MNPTTVIRLVICLLMLLASPAWRASVAVSQESTQYTPQSGRTFDAGNRVTVPAGKIHGVLGDKTRIPIEIATPGLTEISSRQVDFRNGDIRLPIRVDGSTVTCPISRNAIGANYIDIVPLRLGNVAVELSERFSDGGFFVKQVWLDVDAPSRRAEDIRVGPTTIDVGKISLYMKDQPARVYLTVDAAYEGNPFVLSIAPRFAEFRVRSNDAVPAVAVDSKTGLLTPQHPGHAIVETRFGGLSTLSCIVVHEAFSLNGGDRDTSHCEELLSPGERLNDAR